MSSLGKNVEMLGGNMVSVNCSHVINILNLHNNVIIPHQILLINGVVDNVKCAKEKDIVLTLDNIQFLTTGVSENTGSFKFLVDLGKENKNVELTFIFCNTKLLLNVIYERKESFYKIQPLLILAQDEPAECEKVILNRQIIDLNLLLVQCVYGEKLKEAINDRLTFAFHDNCVIFNSKLKQEEIWQLNENDLWQKFAHELLTSSWGDQDHLKFILFINCSKYQGKDVEKSKDFSYNNIRKHIKGHAALGTGGLALFSSTYFYSWPNKFENIINCFLNQQKINLALDPDDSNYRKTRAGVYASSLGAVCHEIGHIFDLGHDLQGVMGSNFDYINQVFTLQTKTEYLPQRIVEQKQTDSREVSNKPHFTRLKNPTNDFLQRYREQHRNDSFYFSPNSAIILAHHPWLRRDYIGFQSIQFNVEWDKSKRVIKSLKIPLKIVEIRKCGNSLVIEWFDLQKSPQDKPVYEFDLKIVKEKISKNFYVFVMSLYGHCKKIEI